MGKRADAQLEKDVFLKELAKQVKAAMILDLFLYDKANALTNSPKVKDMIDFSNKLIMKHTSSRYHFYNTSSTHQMWTRDYSKPDPNAKMKVVKYISTGSNITSRVVEAIFHEKPAGYIKKLPLEALQFERSGYTEEELDWARYIMTEAGINLTQYHIDEYQYEMKFERTFTSTTVQYVQENVWCKTLEEAQALQEPF